MGKNSKIHQKDLHNSGIFCNFAPEFKNECMKRIFGLLISLVLILTGCEKATSDKGGMAAVKDSKQHLTAVEFVEIPGDKYYKFILEYDVDYSIQNVNIISTGYQKLYTNFLPKLIMFPESFELMDDDRTFYFYVFACDDDSGKHSRQFSGPIMRNEFLGKEYLELYSAKEGIKIRIHTKFKTSE